MNVNDNQEVAASQTARILSHMLEGKAITAIEALELYGCFRLSARIKDIEKLLGRAPSRERVLVKNREGRFVRVAKYWL